MAALDFLPGYAWVASVGRYRSLATGRFVGARTIRELMEDQVNNVEARLGNLAVAFERGDLAASWVMEQMSVELRRAHIQYRALGVGGIAQLQRADYRIIATRLRDDYSRVARLIGDLVNDDVTIPQALNRIRGYVGNARLHFFEGQRVALGKAFPARNLQERRVLGVAEHCDDCVNFAARGWVPMGTLPPPTQSSVCGTHCRCSMEFRDAT